MDNVTIVAGVDLGVLSPRVLASARTLTHVGSDAVLHLAHVLRPPVPSPDLLPFVGTALTDDHAATLAAATLAAVAQARGALEALCAEALGVDRSRVTLHVRMGEVVAELRALAEDVDADYLVVGTLGRRGLSRVLHGSTAARLVRTAPCPVLTVRPDIVPRVEPLCPECVQARFESDGAVQWCARHSEHHAHAHTYHGAPSGAADGSRSFPFHG
jgi:nucleotide-binding universal stress UspA family protein